jgi:hypothetical protein
MNETLAAAALVAIWFVLQLFVLPKLGVST